MRGRNTKSKAYIDANEMEFNSRDL
jgi:hypothetical protein